MKARFSMVVIHSKILHKLQGKLLVSRGLNMNKARINLNVNCINHYQIISTWQNNCRRNWSCVVSLRQRNFQWHLGGLVQFNSPQTFSSLEKVFFILRKLLCVFSCYLDKPGTLLLWLVVTIRGVTRRFYELFTGRCVEFSSADSCKQTKQYSMIVIFRRGNGKHETQALPLYRLMYHVLTIDRWSHVFTIPATNAIWADAGVTAVRVLEAAMFARTLEFNVLARIWSKISINIVSPQIPCDTFVKNTNH